MMNVLSLFDGMSCGQIALERAGIKVDSYFASEKEEIKMNNEYRFVINQKTNNGDIYTCRGNTIQEVIDGMNELIEKAQKIWNKARETNKIPVETAKNTQDEFVGDPDGPDAPNLPWEDKQHCYHNCYHTDYWSNSGTSKKTGKKYVNRKCKKCGAIQWQQTNGQWGGWLPEEK